MDSDSDEELPSLATLVTKIKQHRPTPTTVRKQQWPVQDPAEEAIVSKAKDKSRQSRLQTISKSSSSSSVDHATPSKSRGKPGRVALSSSKQIHRSTPSSDGLAAIANGQDAPISALSLGKHVSRRDTHAQVQVPQPSLASLQPAVLNPSIIASKQRLSGPSTFLPTDSSAYTIDLASPNSTHFLQSVPNVSAVASTSL